MSTRIQPLVESEDIEGAEPVGTDTEGQLRTIKVMLIGIFLILLLAAIYFAKDVLLPIVLSVLLMLTLSPVTRGLERIGVPTPVSAVLLIVGIGVGSTVGVYMMSGPVSDLVSQAPEIGDRLKSKLTPVTKSVEAVQEAEKQVQDLADGDSPAPTQKVVVDKPGPVRQALNGLASAGSSIVAAMVLALFMLASGDFFLRRIIEATPKLQDKKKAYRIVRDIEQQISRYLAAITVINAGLGLAIGTALFFIGMPYAFVWGAAAFALNFLPFLGSLIGTILVGAIAFVTFDSASHAMLAPIAYFSLTTLEGQFITPYLVGRRLELNTVSVLITVLFWIWIWGILGALMAVPFLVLIKVICDNIEGWRVFGSFLGAEKPSEHH
ncbi:putative PurR-regulated permease PerM [Brevirhabdus pacifica]|uniref:AI-2E family transporter n=1 Tax=Brevirhabdus pacifica TaxID=1267768 RepID=UPI000CC646C8|nr:AI-2E family transporter [Brevirhabdus pacifica]PJJ86289.1 putative PurR-regulated permease PerM [Brevirhabdus pacifica]